jgi:Flp pilus assembly protein TadD
VNAHIEETYLYPLKGNPEDVALRTRLAQVYVALQRYDDAIGNMQDHLISAGGDKAPIYNHLGIARFLKGDLRQAALDFKEALEWAPEDARIRRNFERVMAALGKGEAVEPVADLVTTAGGTASKSGTQDLSGDSFYWIEQ